jgi:hypothetical protein
MAISRRQRIGSGWIGVSLSVAWLAGLSGQQQSIQSPSLTPVPRFVWFSGSYQPADGRLAAAAEAVTLSMYREEHGGEPLWQETQNVAIAADGRFSLLMGAATSEGLPQDLFTNGESRWLGLRFGGPAGIEQPRLRFTSVPYALKASDADTLGGRPASAYVLAPGSGGTAEARAAGVETSGASADVVLPGTTNFLAKYVSTADVGSSGVFEAADGAVGMGTTTPLDRLHVRYSNNTGVFTGLAVQNTNGGLLAYSGMLFYDHTGALTQFQGYNNATHEYRINNIARVSPGGAFNGSINFMVGGTSRFLVASNGTVTIPGDVVVGGNIAAKSLEVNGTTSLGPPGSTDAYTVENEMSMYPTLAFNTYGTSYEAGVAGYGGLFQFQNSTGDLVYYSGSNVPAGTPHSHRTAFSITGIGKVGIGTASPLAKLHVADLGSFVAPLMLVDGLLGSGGLVTVFQVGARFGVNLVGLSVNNNGVVTIGGVGAAGGSQLCLNASSQIASCSSSLRYKTNIASFLGGLDVVNRLRPISFTWKEDGSSDIGLAAEEVEQVEPRLGFRNRAGEIEGVKYNQLSAVFINAFKEQQAQIQKQQEQLQDQQRQIDALLRLLCSDPARAAACVPK